MPHATSRTRSVLCVDDNPALRDNLREVLEDVGYAVSDAGTCADALAAAQTAGFDVALVDVRLPDGDGVTLAARLREVVPDGQVVMLTGYATIESAVAAVRAGAWAYLMKPCSMPDLLVAVEQAVRQTVQLEDRRELMRRARVAEKLAAIGTLTAGLSHEVKNPLNASALQLAVLERRIRKLPADEQTPLMGPLGLVREEIGRLNRIVEEFLHFASPADVVKQPVDLGDILTRVLDLLAPQAEQAAVTLERRWNGDLAVTGEAERLQQALINLVLNGIEATPRGGRVSLEALRDGDRVVVSVEDTGPGIPDAIKNRLFEPFFTTKPAGSGLGLPLVHGIVEKHGGTISIEGGAGGGARFVVVLPVD